MYRNYLRQKTNKNEVNYPDFKYAVIVAKIQPLVAVRKMQLCGLSGVS